MTDAKTTDETETTAGEQTVEVKQPKKAKAADAFVNTLEVGELENTDAPLFVGDLYSGSLIGSPQNGIPGASQFAALVQKNLG